ncbi:MULTISPECIES: hypothetical protein [Aeromonas]|uniref:hypothetical protein n=1 Tax=Aeromonas TaxID=642 RepID=UPI0013785F9A|nr:MULTISPECIES: hypothetical protein [Aeromonas]MCH7369947.1 hypothetical protein [Aeromonas sp. MR16]
MAQAGGQMRFAAEWTSKVVIVRELITGQNPFSAPALASVFVSALDKRAEAN